jgi:hypothetical protein
MINRRRFVQGLLALPAIVRTPGLLMPVRPIRPQLGPVSGKFYFEVGWGEPATATSAWLNKTPDEVLADVNQIFSIGWDQCQPDWQVVFDDGNLQVKPTEFGSF